ncbi:MAG: hypothetical protein IKH28_11550 [Lachnospiraceae bacterium]|nr:hypothetical protein [Lachnospiraceae bacterium]
MAFISDLPIKTQLNNSDMLVIEDGQHTYKMTYQQFLTLQAEVASFTENNVSGVITLTLTNGTQLTVEPHDPTKVDKVAGKTLTTNDFTDTLKNKLDGIEAEANKYELPPATSDDLGGVRGGAHTSIDENGTISVVVDDELSASSTHPVQNAVVKAALDTKLNTTQKGANGGLAELDSSGKVPASQLPSYVDDVVEGYLYNGTFYEDAQHQTPITPATSAIYVDLVENKTYRWSGSAYVEISESLALGETDRTAFRGDRGKVAYDHATDANKISSALAQKLYKLGFTAEGHAASATEVTKQDLLDMGLSDFSGSYEDLTNKPELKDLQDDLMHKTVTQAEIDTWNAQAEATILSQINGTKAGYDKAMKDWFDLHSADQLTPAELTALCEQWYEVTKDGWDGYVTFADPSVSNVSTGTRGGDNEGKSCAPSTDVTAGTDDFAGLPLFACKDVNFTVDATSLDIVITAIDGITSGFERDNPNKYVGVMQMAGWRYEYDDATSYTEGYRDSFLATYEHIAPLPEAVRVDGTVRKFVVHAKYMSGVVDTKMTSCAGVMTQNFISHNTLHTFSNKNGAQYSGGTTADLAFLKLMTRIKYASLTLDGIMNGCLDYNLQYYAQVAETGVKRVILAANTNLLVGSTIIIGTYNGSSADRGTAANYSISGQRGVVITAIEEVVINETTYKAVTVDIANAFDTAANGSATAGTTIVSTLHWKTGSCDGVLGNDGSPVSNTDSKHPRKLQGIEFTVGGYEVMADVIMNEELIDTHSHYVPAIVKRSANQATSITANYVKIYDLAIANPAAAGWQYIKKEKYANGMYFPSIIGGSSSTFTKDAFYMDKDSTTGTRESLAFGGLGYGLATGGLSYLNGGNGLPTATWLSLARLSPNGNRGEWTA